MAEQLQIPLIALSQKPDIAKRGDYVFRNFLTVADQVATLVGHACGTDKIKEFAILYPQGPGGEEYLKQFESEVEECGGKVVSKKSFKPGSNNFLSPLREMKEGGSHYSEGNEKLAFEALFFPETYRQIPMLVESLKFLNLGKVELLGGAGWDHPDLSKIPQEGFRGIYFVNGFFPRSGEFRTRQFVSSFQAAYGIEPTLLEAYAYDTLRLTGSLLKGSVYPTRSDLQRDLAQLKDFPGVTGTISFDSNGDARRRLFLLTLKDGEIQEVQKINSQATLP
jgi:ABC-type branched-subunit amino acid transport system substrate-binding protein